MELTDHQTHLKSVTEQAQGLVTEIQNLEAQAKSKRDMLLKLQGIIEYLQQTGVELPKKYLLHHNHLWQMKNQLNLNYK